MITIEKLMEAAESALRRHFTLIVNGVKLRPEVYDHTDEIFLDGEEGVAVWCDIPKGSLSFFRGTVSMIINADEDLVLTSVFFGEACLDKDRAEDLCDGLDLGSWEIEKLDDDLMLVSDFPASLDLEEELTRRFGEFLDEGFAGEIKELLTCFK